MALDQILKWWPNSTAAKKFEREAQAEFSSQQSSVQSEVAQATAEFDREIPKLLQSHDKAFAEFKSAEREYAAKFQAWMLAKVARNSAINRQEKMLGLAQLKLRTELPDPLIEKFLADVRRELGRLPDLVSRLSGFVRKAGDFWGSERGEIMPAATSNHRAMGRRGEYLGSACSDDRPDVKALRLKGPSDAAEWIDNFWLNLPSVAEFDDPTVAKQLADGGCEPPPMPAPLATI